MTESLQALVLKRHERGENDLSLVLLTRERGRVDAVARGARKAASRLGACSQPLQVAMIQLAEGKRINYVTQAQPQSAFRGLRSDFARLMHALAWVELVAGISTHELVHEELFDLTIAVLAYLEHHPDPTLALLWGEVKLLTVEGLMPSLVACVACGQAIAEDPAWISPSDGGYLCPKHADQDPYRQLVSGRALVALSRLEGFETPPPHMKDSVQALTVLSHFWSVHFNAPIKARESLLHLLLVDGMS